MVAPTAAGLRTALKHLRAGDWAKAHPLVQEDASPLGCWAHGIVHMMEGDLGNARYWYRTARQPFPAGQTLDTEWRALAEALLAR